MAVTPVVLELDSISSNVVTYNYTSNKKQINKRWFNNDMIRRHNGAILCYLDSNGCIFTGTGRNITLLSDFDIAYILKQH